MSRLGVFTVATVVVATALFVAVSLSDLPGGDGAAPQDPGSTDDELGDGGDEPAAGPGDDRLNARASRARRPAPPRVTRTRVQAVVPDNRVALRLPGQLPPLRPVARPPTGHAAYLPPMSESRQMLLRMEKLMVGIRDEIRAAHGDPARIARALERFHQSSDVDLKRAETLWQQMDPGERDRLSRELQQRLRPVMDEILKSMDDQGVPVPRT